MDSSVKASHPGMFYSRRADAWCQRRRFPARRSQTKKQIVIGASVPLLNDPAWVRIIDYGQYVAKQLGVKLDVVDAQGKEDKQIADVQSLLSRGVDLLVFVPVSASERTGHHPPREPGQSAGHRGRPLPRLSRQQSGRSVFDLRRSRQCRLRPQDRRIISISHGIKNFVAVEGFTPGDANNQERTKGFQGRGRRARWRRRQTLAGNRRPPDRGQRICCDAEPAVGASERHYRWRFLLQ